MCDRNNMRLIYDSLILLENLFDIKSSLDTFYYHLSDNSTEDMLDSIIIFADDYLKIVINKISNMNKSDVWSLQSIYLLFKILLF